jgi:putative hemolysin
MLGEPDLRNGPGPREYPPDAERLPEHRATDGKYTCRFARCEQDLRRIQRLRYEVFNLELGEGLEESHRSGLDQDRFDAQCHHLIVDLVSTGEVIGTYRLQTSEMAARGYGFYSAQEFRLEDWPRSILESSVEVGRACIHRDHRYRNVLLLLWKGLGAYVVHNRKRFFFGCCSLTSQDAGDAARMAEYLRQEGHMHPDLDLQPQPAYDCHEGDFSTEDWKHIHVPALFRTYLRYGARICGRPAMDREFRTIDFLALLDLNELDAARILRQFEVDIRQST